MAKLPDTFARPHAACAAILTWIVFMLWADPHLGMVGQWGLGLGTTAVLVLCSWRLPGRLRLLLGCILVVSIGFEVVGSIVWGAYTYRLGNVPSFVPPGHALVYLFGTLCAQLAWTRRRELAIRILVGCAMTAWAVAGVTVLDRSDMLGSAGIGLVLIMLCRRNGLVWAGVIAMVALIELLGTYWGVWTWQPLVPYTPVTAGNPPSCISAAYVVIEASAIALALVLGSRLVWHPSLGLRSGQPAAAPAPD
jgi:hypothetical protein